MSVSAARRDHRSFCQYDACAAACQAARRRAARSPGREAHPRSTGQLCLLKRGLPALSVFIAVEKLGQILGLVGVDPDDDPGFTPGLFERVADVAHYRLPGREPKSIEQACFHADSRRVAAR